MFKKLVTLIIFKLFQKIGPKKVYNVFLKLEYILLLKSENEYKKGKFYHII